jgi:LCP family protein required for cell wall assembly
MTERGREDDQAPEEGSEQEPRPATWAGRKRSGDPEHPPGAGSGLTDELEAIKDQFKEALDAAAKGVPPEPGAAPESEATGEPGAEEGEAEETGAEEGEPGEQPPEEEPARDAEGGEDTDAGDEAGEEVPPGPGAEAEEEAEPAPETGIGDRDAARDAALAGLRARTQSHTPARPLPATPPAAPTGVPPASAPPPATVATVAAGTPERRGLFPRFLAGSLLIVVSMATATAVSLLVYLTDIAKGLGDLKGVKDELQEVDPGNPQTILILGSDERPGEGGQGRSDTTILLRVDTDEIRLMSIPRDLKVNIPGLGIDKLNAAYSYGGPKLTLKVVKQLTGLEVNHVVNVDFNGFAEAVDAIDCVYIDVDRHYFHSNVGLAASEQYAEIDIEAGYQRLCGLKALQYVRYRHEDNDLVRAARQQDFVREARQKVPPSKLLEDRNELIKIFTRYTSSDIESVGTLIGLFKLFLAARDAPVVQIHFPANLGGPTSAYVTASEQAVSDVVERFLGIEPPPDPTAPPEPKPDRDEKKGEGREPAKPPAPPMDDVTVSAQQYAAAVDDDKLDIPVLYPTRAVPGSTFSDASRSFPIDGPGNQVYRGYKLVLSFIADGYSQYYGVSGTDWEDPPILENPSEERTIGGRNYLLFYDGGRLRLVGWKTKDASYWVNNTLTQSLSEPQLLAVAQSIRG